MNNEELNEWVQAFAKLATLPNDTGRGKPYKRKVVRTDDLRQLFAGKKLIAANPLCRWFGHRERHIPETGLDLIRIDCKRCGCTIVDYSDEGGEA